ncbi:MAG: SCO family protein [Rubripirellula sp.]
MKTLINIAMILLVGVGLGLAIRVLRKPVGAGPGPNDVVYTNDGPPATDPSEIESETLSKPPEDEEWLSRFELTERSGNTVKSEDLAGQPYVVSFFFSTCPSICVKQNQIIKELQDEFEGQGVRFIAISVDPETDTPEKLREYAARFGADDEQWLFMTGDLPYIRRIGGEIFQQPVNKQFHTERFVLVDPKGAIEGFYNWPEKRQLAAMKDKIREMMKAQESA